MEDATNDTIGRSICLVLLALQFVGLAYLTAHFILTPCFANPELYALPFRIVAFAVQLYLVLDVRLTRLPGRLSERLRPFFFSFFC